ncbi:MAG: hypothetical protein IJU77_04305 [Butyrivibrio sp.]|nr:hypothetical protein [Butyrivibrio sp.]
MTDIEDRLDALIQWGADPNAAIRRMIGDEDLFLKLLYGFMNSRDWDILVELVEQGRFDEAFVISHRMKGSAADLSLGPLLNSLCIVTDDLRGKIRDSIYDDLRILYLQRDSLRRVVLTGSGHDLE